MSAFELKLLGPFSLSTLGKVLALRSAKGAGAHWLSRSEGPTDREYLATLLWQRDEQYARHNLRNTLLAVRADLSTFSPLVQSNQRQIWLTSEAFRSDVDQLQHANPAELLTLWRGPFLSDLAFSDTPPWEEWREQQTLQWTSIYLERTLKLGIQAAQAANLTLSEQLATRALEVDPFSEQAAALLLHSYRRDNRQKRHVTSRRVSRANSSVR